MRRKKNFRRKIKIEERPVEYSWSVKRLVEEDGMKLTLARIKVEPRFEDDARTSIKMVENENDHAEAKDHADHAKLSPPKVGEKMIPRKGMKKRRKAKTKKQKKEKIEKKQRTFLEKKKIDLLKKKLQLKAIREHPGRVNGYIPDAKGRIIRVLRSRIGRKKTIECRCRALESARRKRSRKHAKRPVPLQRARPRIPSTRREKKIKAGGKPSKEKRGRKRYQRKRQVNSSEMLARPMNCKNRLTQSWVFII